VNGYWVQIGGEELKKTFQKILLLSEILPSKSRKTV